MMKIKRSLKTPSFNARQNQIGATLIGLMIGLLVSMIGILGSLSLYKTLTQASVDATFDTKHDGNAALTLSRVAFELQSAGFGLPEFVDGTTQPHLKINSTVEVVWRTGQTINATAGQVTCKRIKEVEAVKAAAGIAAPDVKAGVQGRKLLLETTTNTIHASCDDASDLADIDWTGAVEEILNITVLTRLDTTYSKASTTTLINIASIDDGQKCSPYGMVPAEQTTMITISHFSSADLNKSAVARSLSYDVCIGNSAL